LRQGTGARLGRDWRRWRGGFCSFSVLAGPDTGLMAKKAFAARPGARLTRALRAPRGGALALARMRGSYEDNSEEPFVLPPRKKKSGNAGFERQRRLRVSLWDRCPQVDRDTPQTPVGGAINGQWPTPPNSRGRSYQWPMANTPKLPWEELSMANGQHPQTPVGGAINGRHGSGRLGSIQTHFRLILLLTLLFLPTIQWPMRRGASHSYSMKQSID